MCQYTPEHVARHVDLACLKPTATSVDVSVCCQKAIRFGCASVCVNPYHVPIAKRILDGFPVAVGTVVSFPHGLDALGIKARAALDAIQNGASEIDMVLNLAAIKDGDWLTTEEEVEDVSRICRDNNAILKVILETACLKESEIITVCHVASECGADFVKTSTGFGPGGATVRAVELMLAEAYDCEVKASGGIATYEDAEQFLSLGCTRLGSSKIEELLPVE